MGGITTSAGEWSAVAAAWEAAAEDTERPTAEATEALIAALDIQHGDHLLELAAGAGGLGPTWSRLVGPAGRVVLSDIAPGMVDAARRLNGHLDNVDVAEIDASAIDYPDASFDVVGCRMGLMFTPEPATALAEIARVLVPQGRFAALTWAAIEHNPWMTCVGMAAMVHGLVSGGPPVGPGGVFSLGEPTALTSLAGAAGFTSVNVEEIDVVFRAESIEEHVERVSMLAGPLAAAFAAADDEQLAAVRRTAAQLAAAYVTDAGVALPGRALLVSARRQDGLA